MLEKLLHMSALFDFYSPLLTDKQQRCLQMHLLEDFSLSEISQELGISRQAVYDMLRRSEQLMQQYEDKLHLVQRSEKDQTQLKLLTRKLEDLKRTAAVKSTNEMKQNIDDIIQQIAALIK